MTLNSSVAKLQAAADTLTTKTIPEVRDALTRSRYSVDNLAAIVALSQSRNTYIRPPLGVQTDELGRITGLTFDGGTVAITRDSAGRIETIYNSQTEVTQTWAYKGYLFALAVKK